MEKQGFAVDSYRTYAQQGFDVDLHTLRTHQALAEEREALIAGLVAFVFDLEECGHEIPCSCAYSPWS
jgi:hypothetical protein